MTTQEYYNSNRPLILFKCWINEVNVLFVGLPVKIRTEETLGVLYAVKYFEVSKEEK